MADPRHPSGVKPSRKYYAAGVTIETVAKRIDELERGHVGTTAHPWPAAVKRAMLKACDGALSQAAIDEHINRLRLEHEDRVRQAEKAMRARAR